MSKNQPAHVRTPDELKEHLRLQMGHLRRSCEAYDKGELSEAQRLAASCYLLVYDPVTSRPTKSLLLQLGLKSKMLFFDESNMSLLQGLKFQPQMTIGQPLVSMQFGGGSDGRYIPLLGTTKSAHQVKFQGWWEGLAYIGWKGGHNLSRKNLVISLRNQDGGGHVDDHIRDPAYKQMSENADERVTVSSGSAAGVPIKFAHWASMRQIAWELDESIKLVGF